jgi:glutamate synthase (NADPH/NADH) small chain
LNTEIVSSYEASNENAESSANGAGAGSYVSLTDLQNTHDAIFIGIGLGATSNLNIAGENLAGVYDALHIIERINTRDWLRVPLGKTVVVIGAGNTAIDAVTQAKRLGAARVLMIYRRTEKDISAYRYEYELAKKDAVEFVWQTAPVEILTDANGNVAAIRCEKTDGSNQIFDVPCDMVVKAIGQQKQVEFLQPLGVELEEKGRVVVNLDTMQTSNPKIFAGGDCVNGGREAVDAAQTGKLAAQGIHFNLTGEQIEFTGARIPFLEKITTNVPLDVPAQAAEPAMPAEDLGVKSYG